MEKIKLKVGDRVTLKGTKDGKIDNEWKQYFGRFGIEKGDKGTIYEIGGLNYLYIETDKHRPHRNGFLTLKDFELKVDNWKARIGDLHGKK